MKMLANPRHEAFAQILASGKMSVDDAYVEAGFNQNRGNAARLNAHESVKARVAHLKERVQKMQQVTARSIVDLREWITDQLIDNVIVAKTPPADPTGWRPDLAGANKALNLLGLDLGMFVERKEVGKPGEFDGLTIADKRKRIAGIARELGLDRITKQEREVIDIVPEPDDDEAGS